jgi:predicted lipoprotein with Yx(FWY)xxD motif
MTRLPIYATATAAVAVVAAACGGYAAPNTSTGAGAAGTAAATVAVENSKLGRILVDGSGRTLYLFEADRGADSTCSSACAQAWPPLTTNGAPQAGSGTAAPELGTTVRQDHTMQVTYHGHPLYYYVGDGRSGDLTGQALNQFGAKWYVLAPGGSKVDPS